jgi:hypothetical protein
MATVAISRTSDLDTCQVCGKVWAHRKLGIFAPCWNCILVRDAAGRPVHVVWPGCTECVSKPLAELTCSRCGVYVMPHGLWFNGSRLPLSELGRYPAAWRLELWAIEGAPDKALVPYIRAHLRRSYSADSPTRLDVINRALLAAGREPINEPFSAEREIHNRTAAAA